MRGLCDYDLSASKAASELSKRHLKEREEFADNQDSREEYSAKEEFQSEKSTAGSEEQYSDNVDASSENDDLGYEEDLEIPESTLADKDAIPDEDIEIIRQENIEVFEEIAEIEALEPQEVEKSPALDVQNELPIAGPEEPPLDEDFDPETAPPGYYGVLGIFGDLERAEIERQEWNEKGMMAYLLPHVAGLTKLSIYIGEDQAEAEREIEELKRNVKPSCRLFHFKDN